MNQEGQPVLARGGCWLLWGAILVIYACPLFGPKKMIDQRLKELEARGMVLRTVINDRPIAVTYELTELGRTALDILEDLRLWSEKYDIQ